MNKDGHDCPSSSLLTELAAKVRECAANPDRDLAEVIAWMGSVGI